MAARKKLAHRLLGFCVRHAKALSIALYVTALAVFFSLPLAAKRNYLDENALLAGFSHSQIRYSSGLSSIQDAFRSLAATHQPQQSAEAILQHMQIQQWWSHLHTLKCNASTLHGILRAPHGDGKEAILLATPVSGNLAADYTAIQVAVAVLQFLQHVPWLAKDIVWIVPDASCGALQVTREWLDAYHGAQSRFGQSGLLQQALILQMSNNTFNTLHVDTTGWNGQLPMLDLYYLVKRLTENGPALTLSQDVKVPFWQHMSKSLQAYWKSMWPVLCFSWQQAIALPTGVHAEFAKYGIDAITIRTDTHSHEVAWSYGLEEGIIKLAVLLELTMRSLNNLLEQFHHSTTFYVLISPDWHVPFQAHIVPPLLLIVVLVLQAADSASEVTCRFASDAKPDLRCNQYRACSQAIKHSCCIHVTCNVVKWALCAMVNRLQSMLSNEEFPRHETSLYMYHLLLALPVCLAVLAVAQLCSKVFRLHGEASVLLHNRYMRTIALGIAAAQASSLLCVDWATSFYVLLLVVPLLGGKWDNQHSMVHHLLQCCMVLMFAMLIFLPCCLFVSSNAFAPLFQSFQASLTFVPYSLRLITTSWDTTCFSAILTLAAPAYLCTFV